MIVQLEDGTDTAAALASINAAVAAAYPDASAEVTREYSNTFTGFALSAPIGSMDAIRGVSGVQSAFLDHKTQVSDDGDDTPADAEGTGGADARPTPAVPPTPIATPWQPCAPRSTATSCPPRS